MGYFVGPQSTNWRHSSHSNHRKRVRLKKNWRLIVFPSCVQISLDNFVYSQSINWLLPNKNITQLQAFQLCSGDEKNFSNVALVKDRSDGDLLFWIFIFHNFSQILKCFNRGKLGRWWSRSQPIGQERCSRHHSNHSKKRCILKALNVHLLFLFSQTILTNLLFWMFILSCHQLSVPD